MINYDKLKTAHELAFKLCQQTGMRVDVSIACVGDSEYIDYILIDYESEDEDLFSTVDGLIQELTKRIKPEPKYKVGDEAWLLNHLNKPTEAKIVGNMGGDVDLAFKDGTCRYGVISELYPTKESLIAAQIAHWQSLSEPEECQHETNGLPHPIIRGAMMEDRKCIKCGEFYR